MIKVITLLLVAYIAGYGVLRFTKCLVRYDTCCSGNIVVNSKERIGDGVLGRTVFLVYIPLCFTEGICRDYIGEIV